jgi:hypothetical protein
LILPLNVFCDIYYVQLPSGEKIIAKAVADVDIVELLKGIRSEVDFALAKTSFV